MIRSLRLQLTAWYLAFFSVLFLLLCVVLYGALSRSMLRRLDETLISQAGTAAKLLQEELEEMHGDAERAAADVLSELQPSGQVVAILENTDVLAGGTAAQQADLRSAAGRALAAPASETVVALPSWGDRGARAGAHRFSYRARTFMV